MNTTSGQLATALREACDVIDGMTDNGAQPYRETLAAFEERPCIDFRLAFLGCFAHVAEAGFCNCDADNFESKEDFDCAVANCISETLSALNVAEPGEAGDFHAMLYDWLDEAGYEWPE